MKSMFIGLSNLAIVTVAFLLVSSRPAAAEDPYVCQPAPTEGCQECNPPGSTPCYVSCEGEGGFSYCDWCIDPMNPTGNGC